MATASARPPVRKEWQASQQRAPSTSAAHNPFAAVSSARAADQLSARKCYVPRLQCGPPSRYDVTVRVAKDDGQTPDPVTFAAAASTAASRRSASIISAHTAEEVICVVCVTAPDQPSAVAVALTVVADALKAEDLVPSPSR